MLLEITPGCTVRAGRLDGLPGGQVILEDRCERQPVGLLGGFQLVPLGPGVDPKLNLGKAHPRVLAGLFEVGLADVAQTLPALFAADAVLDDVERAPGSQPDAEPGQLRIPFDVVGLAGRQGELCDVAGREASGVEADNLRSHGKQSFLPWEAPGARSSELRRTFATESVTCLFKKAPEYCGW
jgi:hypothetical protein